MAFAVNVIQVRSRITQGAITNFTVIPTSFTDWSFVRDDLQAAKLFGEKQCKP